MVAVIGFVGGCGSSPELGDLVRGSPRPPVDEGPKVGPGGEDGGGSSAGPAPTNAVLPARSSTLPALFDDVPMAIHPQNRDRLGTVIQLHNPAPGSTAVTLIARRDDGTELARFDALVPAGATLDIASFGASRGGLFTTVTRGQRFAVEIHGAVKATAIVARVPTSGTLGTSAAPLQITAVAGIEVDRAELLFPQIPIGGTFDGIAHVTNVGDAPATGVATLSCRTGAATSISFTIAPHGSLPVVARDVISGSEQCALHVRGATGSRLTGMVYWANAGGVASDSSLQSSPAAAPATELGAVRALVNRSGYFSGVTVYNAGAAETEVVLSFSFPNRTDAAHRSFTVSERIDPGAVMMRYLGNPLSASTGLVPIPEASEPGSAGDGYVTVRSAGVDGQSAQVIAAIVNADNRVNGGSWSITSPARPARSWLVSPIYSQTDSAWLTALTGGGSVVVSGLSIHAPSPTTSQCTIAYHLGTDVLTASADAEAGGLIQQFLPNVVANGQSLPTGFTGWASVVCSQPVTVEASARISPQAEIGTSLPGDGAWALPGLALP